MDGFEVMPMDKAAEVGDIFVTVTGNKHVIARRALRAHEGRRHPRNSGHFNVEIDIPALRSWRGRRRAGAFVEEFTARRTAGGIYLLAEGG